MIPTKQATRKQRASSRERNDHRPWGYQPQLLNSRSRFRLKRDVEAGILPKSALAVTITIRGRKNK